MAKVSTVIRACKLIRVSGEAPDGGEAVINIPIDMDALDRFERKVGMPLRDWLIQTCAEVYDAGR